MSIIEVDDVNDIVLFINKSNIEMYFISKLYLALRCKFNEIS